MSRLEKCPQFLVAKLRHLKFHLPYARTPNVSVIKRKWFFTPMASGEIKATLVQLKKYFLNLFHQSKGVTVNQILNSMNQVEFGGLFSQLTRARTSNWRLTI